MIDDPYSNLVIGAAIEVHRILGPGLLESVYSLCLGDELEQAGIDFEREKVLSARYKGRELDCGFRLDFLVGQSLIVEIKTVQQLTPLHNAQVLTYLRMSGVRLGLLINFNQATLKEGIRRIVL